MNYTKLWQKKPLAIAFLAGASLLATAAEGVAQDRVEKAKMSEARKKRAAVLSKRHDMRDKKTRDEVVLELKKAENELQAALRKRAQAKGMAMEGRWADGRGFRLVDFDENDLPVYIQDENVNAAITTAANEVRGNAAYDGVTGSSVTIGLWEASGVPRLTHREFGGRITVQDGTTAVSGHGTHVAGTLAAEGINSSVMGMAPEARISAFGVSGEIGEMTANGASEPDSDKLYLSNHSYGTGQGWERNDDGWVFQGTFSDDGDPTNDFERDFGRYSRSSANWDGITSILPYYLVFVSSGNQRSDNPSEGDTWTRGTTTYTYDPDEHPAGDRFAKDGWDNMEGRKMAKNVITVGNAADAVTDGVRDVSEAVTASSSSRGPTDDGRIKPDITANGQSLRSTESGSDTATGTRSGTSMSTPNVCGSAALLVDYYTSQFPSEAMRASTLKALILHTADDDGNPGPDYRYGWGIMNTKQAADVIKLHASNDGGAAMLESSLDLETTTQTHTFRWDGSSPLRVTLCWTDPAGAEKEEHESREKALVNDLNVKVTGPGGTHFPYVMPHVGDWSVESIDEDAVTGVNDVDTVEQVYLPSATAGVYVVTVDYAGSLRGTSQDYSLIATGQASTAFSALEEWRFVNFGTESNTGDAADTFDFDDDGLSNLIEFGLATSPRESDQNPVTFGIDETNATLSYSRSVAAMADFDFEVVWSDELASGEWVTTGVAEDVVSDDGLVQQVKASLPIAGERRFFRVQMTER